VISKNTGVSPDGTHGRLDKVPELLCDVITVPTDLPIPTNEDDSPEEITRGETNLEQSRRTLILVEPLDDQLRRSGVTPRVTSSGRITNGEFSDFHITILLVGVQ
jgi:hypothetical protein